LPFCNEPKNKRSGDALIVKAELRFFRPNRTPLQVVSRGMWIGEDTGIASIHAGETKYLILAICQTEPPNPDFFLSVEDLRDLAVTRGNVRMQREAVRFARLEKRARFRVRHFVDGSQAKIFWFTLSLGTRRIVVRTESMKLRRAVCWAKLRRSAVGSWYRRMRRTQSKPVIIPDPSDDHSKPLP
jgi:hypothetical protein